MLRAFLVLIAVLYLFGCDPLPWKLEFVSKAQAHPEHFHHCHIDGSCH